MRHVIQISRTELTCDRYHALGVLSQGGYAMHTDLRKFCRGKMNMIYVEKKTELSVNWLKIVVKLLFTELIICNVFSRPPPPPHTHMHTKNSISFILPVIVNCYDVCQQINNKTKFILTSRMVITEWGFTLHQPISVSTRKTNRCMIT